MGIVQSIQDTLKADGKSAAIQKLKGLGVADLNSIVANFTADDVGDAASIVAEAKAEITNLENQQSQTTDSDSQVDIEKDTTQTDSNDPDDSSDKTPAAASATSTRKKLRW